MKRLYVLSAFVSSVSFVSSVDTPERLMPSSAPRR